MRTCAGRGRLAATSLRYVMTAGCVTCLYLAILKSALALGIFYLWAIAISQLCVIPPAFFAYRGLVFGVGASLRSDFRRFLSVWVTGAALGALGTPVLVELLGWDPWLAQ